MFKRDKYAELRTGVKSLCSGHKVSGIQLIFDFLAAYSINLENELTKFYKKVVSKTIEVVEVVDILSSTPHRAFQG